MSLQGIRNEYEAAKGMTARAREYAHMCLEKTLQAALKTSHNKSNDAAMNAKIAQERYEAAEAEVAAAERNEKAFLAIIQKAEEFQRAMKNEKAKPYMAKRRSMKSRKSRKSMKSRKSKNSRRSRN